MRYYGRFITADRQHIPVMPKHVGYPDRIYRFNPVQQIRVFSGICFQLTQAHLYMPVPVGNAGLPALSRVRFLNRCQYLPAFVLTNVLKCSLCYIFKSYPLARAFKIYLPDYPRQQK